MRPKGVAIRDHIIRVGSVGVVVVLYLEKVVLSIGTLHIIHFSIGVSLVDLFRPRFRVPMEASLGLVIVLKLSPSLSLRSSSFGYFSRGGYSGSIGFFGFSPSPEPC